MSLQKRALSSLACATLAALDLVGTRGRGGNKRRWWRRAHRLGAAK